MNIGIIGAGLIGGTLARRLSLLNHKVTIANSRGPETLKDLATEINVKAGTAYEAARNNDIAVITIPQKNIADLPKDLFEGVKDDVIVIDWVQAKIKRPIVKTFNSIAYTSLGDAGRPKGDKNRIALPVSGDRKKDKEAVSDLLDQLGFDFFDVGELKNSWKYEPGTPTYCMDFNLETLKNKLNDLGTIRTPEIKANIIEQRTEQEKQFLEYYSKMKK
jgi:8-hydroxy-5-deazaflavin:NADPH oxidoreductase